MDDNEELKFTLHPDDPAHFLKLLSALRLLIKHTITDADIEEADQLIREYCTGLIKLYGSSCVKPNHHYATHTTTFVRNFGPLHDFWTFLFERLNKVLKSFKTNNHSGSELETTFFCEFHRMCQSSRLTYSLLQQGTQTLQCEAAEIMLKASSEERGTVAGLAALSKELDEVHADAGQQYGLSPRRQCKIMTNNTYQLLAQTICFQSPETPVHCRSNCPVVPHSLPLNREATFFDYVTVKGKRYYASRSVRVKSSSLVQVGLPHADRERITYAHGEITEIFQFDQDIHHKNESMWFARMRWFKSWTGERDDIWDKFAAMNVRLWEIEEYHDKDTQLPALISPQWICGHLALKTVSIGANRIKVWATIDLAKAVL
ncbi:hypothetical protein PAXINDRAFT_15245 [Paxillus involutus ATCC 200175]|uniref:Uncharacterized protein n=1 Tax=Paxillus involutus ATCC 200175 TaxID=664439 RepID=A0A0C9ST87_PAXIN|nr:hypothetical protein PAXINDRAFT_15245 [Paxillus involutus ATCC 200175]